MIPKGSELISNLEIVEKPSKTHKLEIEGKYIASYCDHLEAMRQLVYQILNTERYQYLIYSWNYGIELQDLYGEPITYVCPELERRIREALTQDKRIKSVEAFVFDTSRNGILAVSFTVSTIFGKVVGKKEVTI